MKYLLHSNNKREPAERAKVPQRERAAEREREPKRERERERTRILLELVLSPLRYSERATAAAAVHLESDLHEHANGCSASI